MGLITKKVKIVLNPNNIKHYEFLGYKIPRRLDKKGRMTIPKGTELLVNIDHLASGSIAEVDVECDNCEKILKKMVWNVYMRYVKSDGKYYCNNCAKKLYASENTAKTKLKNGKSFEQWCIDNGRKNILNLWDYELNNCKPSEILYATNKKYYFKCPRKLHKSELKTVAKFTNLSKNCSINCNQCNSFAQWGIDHLGKDFLDKYWDYEKNLGVSPWEIDYSSGKSIWIRCQEKDYHGSYKILCARFIKGDRCAYCSNRNGKVHILDSLGTLYPEVLNIWSNKNKKTPYDYSPRSQQEVYWKCPNNKHKDYRRSISNSNLCEFRCPECTRERDESFLQEKVRQHLKNLNYNILHENNCTLNPKNIVFHPTLKRKCKLKYDNEIIINGKHLIIEVHGIQHYEICGFHKLQAKKNKTTPEIEFKYGQEKDKFKKDYAIGRGYGYLEIPYYDINNVEIILDEYLNSLKDVLHIV